MYLQTFFVVIIKKFFWHLNCSPIRSSKFIWGVNILKNVKKGKLCLLLSTVIFGISLVAGCGGGGGDDGTGPEIRTRVVTGAVSGGTAKNISPTTRNKNSFAAFISKSLTPEAALAAGMAGTFRVTAVARDGSIHEVDTDAGTGEFMMELPAEECYTMSFTAHTGEGMMDEFMSFMVLGCGPEHVGEFDDQLCLSDGGGPVDMGTITVQPDHSFASPMHNPLEDVDFDGDGVMDFDDDDYVCGNVEDDNHDGYYDDDMDQDGFHDDDMDFDGFHDGDMDQDGFHDGGDMDRDDFSHGGQMGGGMM